MTNADGNLSTGRGPLFWAGLMFGAYGIVAALALSDAIEGLALNVLVIAPFGLVFPMLSAATRRADSTAASCVGKGVAQRRYSKRVAVCSFLYLIAIGLMTFVFRNDDPHPAVRLMLALLPGLAVIGIFWAVGRLIVEEKDEFLRMLIIRQSLIATGISLSAATVWGFLESADLVPHLDAYWWAVAWFFGLGVGAVVNKIHYGTWGAA